MSMKRAKVYKILLLAGIVLIFLAVPLFVLKYKPVKNLEVDFLDVGQGDAILIKSPFGQNILIDGGPDGSVLEELSDNLPFWDRQIDLMILTHPHDDHVTGLIDVLKRYKVKKILFTGVVHDAPNYLEWLSEVKQKKISLMIIDRPQTIKLGEDCNLEILFPLDSLVGREVENLNNSSIVARLVQSDKKFLFMGDAEVEEENALLASGVELSAQVLKVGHHGSDTSTSEGFLRAVKAERAIIEVGEDNDFGHPNLRILKRLERIGAKTFRTDLEGTIKIREENNQLYFD